MFSITSFWHHIFFSASSFHFSAAKWIFPIAFQESYSPLFIVTPQILAKNMYCLYLTTNDTKLFTLGLMAIIVPLYFLSLFSTSSNKTTYLLANMFMAG